MRFRNKTDFFLYLSTEVAKADDELTPEPVRRTMYANMLSELRASFGWGKITMQEYRNAHNMLCQAQNDNNREVRDLLGHLA